MFFLTGCGLQKQPEDSMHVAESAKPEQVDLFKKPMRAAFLLDIRGKEHWLLEPEFQFKTERAYLAPSAKNIVFFRAADVTWNEFFSSVGVKIEGDCLTLQDEKVCATEGEKFQVVLNSEPKEFDSTWPIRSGDRLFIGIQKDAVTRQTLAHVPDPWTVEE